MNGFDDDDINKKQRIRPSCFAHEQTFEELTEWVT